MKSLIFIGCLLLSFGIWAQNNTAGIDAHIRSGQYEKAELILLNLLKSKPSQELKDKLGEVYGYQQKWGQAIEVYEELTDTYPGNSEYFFRYGGVLAKKAQSSSALVALMYVGRIKGSFKKALVLDPSSIKIHWALIDLYVSLPGIVGGSNSKARNYANQLKSLSSLDGYLAQGYIDEYDDKPRRAKEQYMKALDLLGSIDEIDRNQLNYQIGKICSDYGLELDRGIAHLNAYINNYTVMDGVPLEWAYYRMAKIYRQKSDKFKASHWIDKALGFKPDFKPALDEKSAIAQL